MTDIKDLLDNSTDDFVTIELDEGEVAMLWRGVNAGYNQQRQVVNDMFNAGFPEEARAAEDKLDRILELLQHRAEAITITVESPYARELRYETEHVRQRVLALEGAQETLAPDRLAASCIELYSRVKRLLEKRDTQEVRELKVRVFALLGGKEAVEAVEAYAKKGKSIKGGRATKG